MPPVAGAGVHPSLPATRLTAVDGLFQRFLAERRAPGVAWGVVADGGLVHTGGAGTLVDGEDRRPDQDSVFRIASMTKSFTAATLLLLRDEGALRLDDPAAQHVPELAGWHGPTSDSPPVTIRHLLTMTAGMPTDDPWGDRQQALDLGAFAELLRAGPRFAWPPGTTFEYSNLGYGILGRVISNVAGREYREVVEARLLRPLGLDSTTFLVDDVPQARLAHGYVPRDGGFVAEPLDGYGALASMGGILTSVRDLGRWVSGFLDAFPARDDPEGGHPLRRASRREMQQLQRSIGPGMTVATADAEPVVEATGYGFGLFLIHDLELGTIVAHSGGYPGFGSQMRWHPGTGVGVIALANGRYAPVREAAGDALRLLVRERWGSRRRVRPTSRTEALQAAAERLIERWDDGLADATFAMNLDLDEPRALRRRALERLREVHGALEPQTDSDDPDGPGAPRSDSPFDRTWWLRGERGRVRISILATPEPEPRLQRLDVTSVPEPAPELAALAAEVLALAAAERPSWPPERGLAATLDAPVIERGLLAARARFGDLALGDVVAGDGSTTATWHLRCERGRAQLRVAVDADGAVAAATIVPGPFDPPGEAW